MRKKRLELNVDTIGSQKDVLTKNEEKMISEYIRSRKRGRNEKTSKNKISAQALLPAPIGYCKK